MDCVRYMRHLQCPKRQFSVATIFEMVKLTLKMAQVLVRTKKEVPKLICHFSGLSVCQEMPTYLPSKVEFQE